MTVKIMVMLLILPVPPFVYENDIITLVHKLKYGGEKYLAEIMAEFMADEYYENEFTADIITYVPMHAKKQHKRGYNQSKEIAVSLSNILNLPLVDTLERIKFTENLARLNKFERAKTIKNAIALNKDVNIVDRNILLIDDVFTTGSTCNECSKLLKKGKCGKIFVLTFATGRIHIELY